MTGLDMSLQEAMSTQRAVRRVKPDPVDDALVLRLIELAQKAPTQQDTQAWEFIVVKDEIVIIEPHSRKIVTVIERRG